MYMYYNSFVICDFPNNFTFPVCHFKKGIHQPGPGVWDMPSLHAGVKEGVFRRY